MVRKELIVLAIKDFLFLLKKYKLTISEMRVLVYALYRGFFE